MVVYELRVHLKSTRFTALNYAFLAIFSVELIVKARGECGVYEKKGPPHIVPK